MEVSAPNGRDYRRQGHDLHRGRGVAVTPYYVTPCGAITVFNTRWENVVAEGVVEPNAFALIHADPPYGLKLRTTGRGAGRKVGNCSVPMRERSWAPIEGDEKPFEPAPLLALNRPIVLWGANHYASRLPDSPSWLHWDKRDGSTPDNGADGELAWTNLGGPLRTFRHLWKGTLRASEAATAHLHPTQKPEVLSAWVFRQAKLKRGDLLFVPYLGSGPDLRPALALGLRVIACEVVEAYCRAAVAARLGAVAHEEAATALGPLFARG